MKWGVRRYQHEDGTLTEEGRQRYYNTDGTLTKKGLKSALELSRSVGLSDQQKEQVQQNAEREKRGVENSFGIYKNIRAGFTVVAGLLGTAFASAVNYELGGPIAAGKSAVAGLGATGSAVAFETLVAGKIIDRQAIKKKNKIDNRTYDTLYPKGDNNE